MNSKTAFQTCTGVMRWFDALPCHYHVKWHASNPLEKAYSIVAGKGIQLSNGVWLGSCVCIKLIKLSKLNIG
jgi:hypothetical protein